MATTVVFTPDGGSAYTLLDSNVLAAIVDVETAPPMTIETQKLGRREGKSVVGTSYEEKPIAVSGKIQDSSAANLRTRLDAMKAAVVGKGTLDVTKEGDNTKRYTVYVQSVALPDAPYQLTWFPFSFVFMAYQPYGEDTSQTTVYTNGSVTGDLNQTHTFAGSANPKVNLKISGYPETTDGSTARIVEVRNLTTKSGMIIDLSRGLGSFPFLRVLEIDTASQMVTVDAQATSYNGNVPSFVPGSNNWQVKFYKTDTIFFKQELFDTERPVGLGWAQQFTLAANTNFNRLDLLLSKVGNPGNITYTITEGVGFPGSTVVATGTILASDIGTQPFYITVPFTTVNGTLGDTYQIDLTTASPPTQTDAIYWKASSTNPLADTSVDPILATAGGDALLIDFCFRVFKAVVLTGLSASVVLKSTPRWR